MIRGLMIQVTSCMLEELEGRRWIIALDLIQMAKIAYVDFPLLRGIATTNKYNKTRQNTRYQNPKRDTYRYKKGFLA